MADGFEAMVDSARDFFAQLARNNSKDWFDPRKQRYTDEIKKPAELFGDLIAEDLARLTGQPHKPKLFRIYRDVRFSKDKTPLNTHLHLLWTPVDAGAIDPSWFFGLSNDYFLMGAGLMGLQGEALTRFRAHIDRHGDALQEALTEAGAHGVTVSDWGPEPPKRVPKPYPPDHPHADLLKRKALAVHAPMPDDWRDTGLVKAAEIRLSHLKPVVVALSL